MTHASLNVTTTHGILCSGSTSCAFHSYPSNSLQPENPYGKRREAAADEIRRIVNEKQGLNSVFFSTYPTNFEFFVQLRGYLEAGNSLPSSINVNPRPWNNRVEVYTKMAEGMISSAVPATDGLHLKVAQLIHLKYELIAGTNFQNFKEHYDFWKKWKFGSLQQSDEQPQCFSSVGDSHFQTDSSSKANGHSDQQTHCPTEVSNSSGAISTTSSPASIQTARHQSISSRTPLVFLKQFERPFGKGLMLISPRLQRLNGSGCNLEATGNMNKSILSVVIARLLYLRHV